MKPIPTHRRSIDEKRDVQTRQSAVNEGLSELGIYNGDPWWMIAEQLLKRLQRTGPCPLCRRPIERGGDYPCESGCDGFPDDEEEIS